MSTLLVLLLSLFRVSILKVAPLIGHPRPLFIYFLPPLSLSLSVHQSGPLSAAVPHLVGSLFREPTALMRLGVPN